MKVQIDFSGFTQKLYVNDQPFIAKIFDAEGEPPEGFNSICISLDLSESSRLDWKREIELAQKYRDRGFFILWDLRFTLHSSLYEDDADLLPLHLAIQHFIETVFVHYHQETLGVILYRFKDEWTNFSRIIEDLKLLAAPLPDDLACFLFLDTTAIELESYFRLILQDHWGHLKLCVKGPYFEQFPYSIPALGWENSASPLGYCAGQRQTIPSEKRVSQALCFPEHAPIGSLQKFLDRLSCTTRFIPEALLHQQWEGIDRLIIFPEFVSERGWRKINGFRAAGGEVINFPDGVT